MARPSKLLGLEISKEPRLYVDGVPGYVENRSGWACSRIGRRPRVSWGVPFATTQFAKLRKLHTQYWKDIEEAITTERVLHALGIEPTRAAVTEPTILVSDGLTQFRKAMLKDRTPYIRGEYYRLCRQIWPDAEIPLSQRSVDEAVTAWMEESEAQIADGERASGTYKLEWTRLKKVLRFFVDSGYIAKNLLAITAAPQATYEGADDNAYTDEDMHEVHRLLARFVRRATPEDLAEAVAWQQLAIIYDETGMRVAEALNIVWPDWVDRCELPPRWRGDRSLLSVVHPTYLHLRGTKGTKRPGEKGAVVKERIIPLSLSPQLAAAVEALRPYAEANRGYLVPFRKPATVSKYFADWITALGIDTGVRPLHRMRARRSGIWRIMGFSDALRSRLLGNTTQVLRKHYDPTATVAEIQATIQRETRS